MCIDQILAYVHKNVSPFYTGHINNTSVSFNALFLSSTDAIRNCSNAIKKMCSIRAQK